MARIAGLIPSTGTAARIGVVDLACHWGRPRGIRQVPKLMTSRGSANAFYIRPVVGHSALEFLASAGGSVWSTRLCRRGDA